MIIAIAAALALAFTSACGKAESPEKEPQKKAKDAVQQAPAAADRARMASEEDVDAAKAPGGTKKADDARDLKAPMLAPMEQARDRLLEYSIALSYESEDFTRSRQELLQIASKYGFVKGSSAARRSGKSSMDTEIVIRVKYLYDALKELDSVGTLVAENISVTDHTEGMEWNRRRANREQIRIERKNRAMGQVNAAAKNYAELEATLGKSEDELDRTAFEQWKTLDRVQWAHIKVHVTGPRLPSEIEVPPYRNALIGMVNLALFLGYALIWLSPIIVIAAFAWLKRKSIARLFGKKGEGGEVK